MAGSGRGKLVIMSGPSGSGKSTVVRQLLEACEKPLRLSVSATTRPPREGEQHGKDYHFLTQEEFLKRRDRGEFLESMEVFGRGHLYGTLRQEVTSGLERGEWVLLEIDVDGALEVLQQCPEAVTIFLDPGSMEELERRLRGRGTESEEAIQRRLEVARREMDRADRYHHRVINHSVDQAVRDICAILSQCGD